jgi:predicted DNA-binding transcriptional regulator
VHVFGRSPLSVDKNDRSINMPSNESKNVLKDLTLKVYHLLLREDKPLSIRAVQRKLELSSPSLAFYHLNKLENAGLIRQTPRGYVVDSVLLGDLIRLKRMFIPRFVFYVGFFVFVLIVELTIYKPSQPTAEYIFHVLISLLAILFFVYESIRVWYKEKNR